MKIKEKDKLRLYFGRAPDNKEAYDFIAEWPEMQM